MANLRVDKITSTETFETTGSVQFDGVDDGLTISDNAAFDLGTGDFTIEGWYYLVNAGTYQSLMDWRGSGADGNYPALLRNNTGDYIYYYVDSAVRITNVEISYDTWFHVSICRFSGITKLFIDGKEKGSFADTISYVSRDILLGLSLSNSNDLKGHISNFRVIKGQALYTENFKPPMRELEVVPGTVLLCCQSKTDASLEKTGKTITVTGNAVANELTPGLLTPIVKSGGGSAITGSVEFDGTGDFLQIVRGSNTDFEFGTQDFTIEFFAHFAKTGMRIMSTGDNGNYTTGGWVFETNNQFGVADSAGNFVYYGAFTYPTNSWAHISVVRNGSNIYGFVNGIQQWSNTITKNITFSGTNDFSLGTGRSGSSGLGDYNLSSSVLTKGFISNFRINKGTALYTADFIPPTRELKRVPGTVLLCCQDPNNPLTEATGKTITGYGDLERIETERVINGTFNSDSDWTKGNGWTISGGTASHSGASAGLISQDIITVPGKTYVYTIEVSNIDGPISLRWEDTAFNYPNSAGTYSFEVTASGSSTDVSVYAAANRNVTIDNFSVKPKYESMGSNFTPQVGDDRKVTFEGVTKIDTENYFYLPTGDTASRETTGTYNAGTRGIFGGGFVGPSSGSQRDTIQYINIATTGNAIDAGDLTQARYGNAALASDTRAVWAGGINPSPSYFNTIDAVEIMSTGNAFDFGDLYANVHYPGGVSNRTRGIYAGGYQSPSPAGFKNNIGYITIASKGDTQDFGDLITAKNSYSTFGSPTRGCFAGGASPSKLNTIEYVTIATTGNGQDFGDLTATRNYGGGCGSAIRGLVGGGSTPTAVNTIDYVTISAMGSAADFGDLTSARQEIGSCSSATRGVFAGAWYPSKVNTIDFVSIQTTGNAKDFGDLVNIGVMQECGTSNGHGGLG
jgi:hypothetical protein